MILKNTSKPGGMSIKLKLSLSFIFLLAMMCISGAGGLFYINLIKGNITTLTDTASPLFKSANTLLSQMQTVNGHLLQLLRSNDSGEIQEKAAAIDLARNEFEKTLEELKSMITAGKVNLATEDLIKTKDHFFQKIPEAVDAHRLSLAKDAALKEQCSLAETLIDDVDKELASILAGSKAAMTEKEDLGKTMVQSGQATVQDLERILSELFNQDYYVVDGINALRTYLVELDGLARTYVAEHSTERLPPVEKKYTNLVKKFKSRLKRVKSRLKTKKDKEAYNKITQEFDALQKNVVSESGAFHSHREILNIMAKIMDQKTALNEATHTFRLSLKEIYSTSSQLIKEGESLTKHAVSRARINISALVGISIIIGVATGFFIIRAITVPLSRAVSFVGKLSGGDLTQKLDIRHYDETGVLMTSLNTMSENLRKIFLDFSSGVKTLISSSKELSQVSEHIYSNSNITAEKSDIVATSTEEMSTNMNEVAIVTQQAVANIQTIASAVEEMTATIQELAGNTAKGNDITVQAVKMAQTVTEKVDTLGTAVSQINEVTETINDIAEQTNLLALNATIEASRAGEAGKGFAVVAGEIKSLSQQTAQATIEINSRITEVKNSTNESVSVIGSIIKVINEINGVVSAISAAIEEQSATTNEISVNINQAASGVQSISEKIGWVSTATGEIAEDISGVNQINQDNRVTSEKIKEHSAGLTDLAAGINEMVSQFKI